MADHQAGPALDTKTVDFLTQECERLLMLYSQAQSNTQSVFNFYLTFVTTVVGGVVVILQISQSDALRTQLMVSGILLFTALVGSVYLSALSGRYAHAARYAYAVDEIRRYLINRQFIQVPEIYLSFLAIDVQTEAKRMPWYAWLSPTGTYEMFMAVVNGASLAAVTYMAAHMGQAALERGLLAAVIVFFVTLTVYNAYSRLIIREFGRRFSVDLWNDLPAWGAARES